MSVTGPFLPAMGGWWQREEPWCVPSGLEGVESEEVRGSRGGCDWPAAGEKGRTG